jgi:hypothetical protein
VLRGVGAVGNTFVFCRVAYRHAEGAVAARWVFLAQYIFKCRRLGLPEAAPLWGLPMPHWQLDNHPTFGF